MLQLTLKFIQASPHWSGEKETNSHECCETLPTPVYILNDNFSHFFKKLYEQRIPELVQLTLDWLYLNS